MNFHYTSFTSVTSFHSTVEPVCPQSQSYFQQSFIRYDVNQFSFSSLLFDNKSNSADNFSSEKNLIYRSQSLENLSFLQIKKYDYSLTTQENYLSISVGHITKTEDYSFISQEVLTFYDREIENNIGFSFNIETINIVQNYQYPQIATQFEISWITQKTINQQDSYTLSFEDISTRSILLYYQEQISALQDETFIILFQPIENFTANQTHIQQIQISQLQLKG